MRNLWHRFENFALDGPTSDSYELCFILAWPWLVCLFIYAVICTLDGLAILIVALPNGLVTTWQAIRPALRKFIEVVTRQTPAHGLQR